MFPSGELKDVVCQKDWFRRKRKRLLDQRSVNLVSSDLDGPYVVRLFRKLRFE